MNCGVCRYPNESRTEYFQTPLFVRQNFHRNEHAIKFDQWQEWQRSLRGDIRPNIPEDYGMKSILKDEYVIENNPDLPSTENVIQLRVVKITIMEQFDPVI